MVDEIDDGRPPRLQRRLFSTPRGVGTDGRGWPSLESEVVRLFGPHRISGGWWGKLRAGASVATARDYYYAESESGALWWVYFDRSRERWFVHGVVD